MLAIHQHRLAPPYIIIRNPYSFTFLSPAAGTSKQTGVDCVNHRRGRDPLSAKEPSIEALDRLFSAADLVELDVDLALAVGVKRNVNNMAILFLTFSLDVVFEFFDPGITGFPANV